MRLNAFPKTTFLLPLIALVCMACGGRAVFAAEDQKAGTENKVYRIAYLEGGPFWEFSGALDRAKDSIASQGWGQRVEFPPELHLSGGWGIDNAATLRKYGRELLNRNDVDLILSAGTDATQALLAVNNGRIPIVGMSVSDPIRSGIIPSDYDSGVDNFTVYFERDVYERLFRIFHLAVGFKKLGIMYSTVPNGKLYANEEEAQKIARERGFKVIEYGKVSERETEDECMAGLKALMQQGMDAFYIPSVACFDNTVNPQSTFRLIKYLMDAKIPTFSRDGTIGVRSGALLGLSNLNLASEGEFLANMILSILKGAKPRSLPMVFKNPPSLSLNMYTADKIGYSPSFDLLTSCDAIFRTIAAPNCP